MDRDGTTRRGRWALAALALALVGAGLVACSSSDTDTASRPTTTTTAGAETAASTVPYDPDQTYGVGQRAETFVDESRGTAALPDRALPAQDKRSLPTIILFPTEVDGAQEPAEGAFPLVVFSHGTGVDASVYAPFLEPLARKGYIVALPTFPLSSLPGAEVDDAHNQPADVSFVIDQLLDLSGGGDSWLAGHIDPAHIGAAGHSLGAVTTVGLVYDSCCIDERVKAAVVMAGVGVPSNDGTLDDRPPTPLLLLHGAKDNIVPVSGGDDLFEAATGPAYYLRYDQADHFGFAVNENSALTAEAVIAFLDAELKDQPAALDAMPDTVAASGLDAQWQTKNVD
jgi:dipeptidyl aminopeptidase/acylaminoacyl peptidase